MGAGDNLSEDSDSDPKNIFETHSKKLFKNMTRPKNVFEPDPNPKNSPLGPPKAENSPQIFTMPMLVNIKGPVTYFYHCGTCLTVFGA